MNLKTARTVIFAAAICLMADFSFAVMFTGTGAGDIPDSPYGGPAQYGADPTNMLVVRFAVSNLQSSVQSVSLSITMRHQYLGDLDVRLKSPAGTNFVIFSHCGAVGADEYGNPAYLGAVGMPNDTAWATNWGTYTFADSGQYSLRGYTDASWGGFNNGPDHTIPSGTYRTSSVGTNDFVTSFATNSGFIGLTPAQAAGTWELTLRDGSQLGVGAVQSATLSLGQSTFTPPHFTSIGVTNGTVFLTLTGGIGDAYTLRSTTNLSLPFASWSTNGGGTFDAFGNAAFSTNAAGAMRFYRATSP